MMTDDRTPQEKFRFNRGVAAYDTFLSGWGMAEGKASIAIWACEEKDLPAVKKYVKSRPDMTRVKAVVLDNHYTPPQNALVHIYVWRKA